jgi:DNA-binding transcriptional ArsR family regulator
MSVETFRAELTAKLRDFAWDQWSQMGVSGATPATRDRRVADPEALLLFTWEVGRHDPRLFDEVMDWLVLNESLISVQRLRNLCVDDMDRALVDGGLTWVARWRPRARLSAKARTDEGATSPQTLFVGLSAPRGTLEPSFARVGLLRPDFEPSQKSQPPDYAAPINLAFRLRRFLGIGARAEAVRLLLTADAPRVTAGVVQASAGFARPNVREALAQLRDAGLAISSGVGQDVFYAIRRDDWARLLQISAEGIPEHRDWIQTLGPLRLVLRWLYDDGAESVSEYMRASEARALLERVEPDLRFAGFPVEGRAVRGAAFWDEFVHTINGVVASL